jgi:hypothetical protein
MFWITFYKCISKDAFMIKCLKTEGTKESPRLEEGIYMVRMGEYQWHLFDNPQGLRQGSEGE